jgi:hypothetical protein
MQLWLTNQPNIIENVLDTIYIYIYISTENNFFDTRHQASRTLEGNLSEKKNFDQTNHNIYATNKPKVPIFQFLKSSITVFITCGGSGFINPSWSKKCDQKRDW